MAADQRDAAHVAVIAPPRRRQLVAAEQAYGMADGALRRRNGVALRTNLRWIGIG
jgi:hypothetical protein